MHMGLKSYDSKEWRLISFIKCLLWVQWMAEEVGQTRKDMLIWCLIFGKLIGVYYEQ